MTSIEMYAKVEQMQKDVDTLRRQAYDVRLQELRAMTINTRLVYAAHARCPCGAGMAYDPAGDDCWDCSDILMGTADRDVQHTARLPFIFYELKSETQPSANGMTTRKRQEQT
jgi:hypothetical protein